MPTAPIDTPGEIEGVVRASELDEPLHTDRQEVEWSRNALEGRLGELSGTGACSTLSWTLELVRTSQADDEPVAWVTAGPSTFFPPDARRNGVDLRALPVVRTKTLREAARAADKLLRSGGFGLVVVDTCGLAASSSSTQMSSHRRTRRDLSIPTPLQKRLVQHADDHETAVLCLTEKSFDSPSLGALVSFRGQTARKRKGNDHFECELRAVADNRFGPDWECREVYRGPPGLR